MSYQLTFHPKINWDDRHIKEFHRIYQSIVGKPAGSTEGEQDTPAIPEISEEFIMPENQHPWSALDCNMIHSLAEDKLAHHKTFKAKK